MDGGATPHCGADTNGLVWLTANKDRQEKSRQPRRAKSDKPPGLPERVRWVMLVAVVQPRSHVERERERSWYVIGTSWCVCVE